MMTATSLSLANGQVQYLFGWTEDTWLKIILAAISVVIGGILTFFFQIGIVSRTERIKLIGKLTDRRISAYEKIIDMLDLWGQVVSISKAEVLRNIPTPLKAVFCNYDPTMLPIVFLDAETFSRFLQDWQMTVKETHLWIDKNTLEKCRYVSWYLSEVMKIFNADEIECELTNEEKGEAISNAISSASPYLFLDYHMLADPIYSEITGRLQKAKLFITKVSLRDINATTFEKYQNLVSKTFLSIHHITLMLLVYLNLGFTMEKALGMLARTAKNYKDFQDQLDNSNNDNSGTLKDKDSEGEFTENHEGGLG